MKGAEIILALVLNMLFRVQMRADDIIHERMVAKTQRLAKDRQLSKASRTMESPPPATANRETLDILRILHPQPHQL